jgi:hypothetical protein
MNSNSEKYYVQKMTREIIKVWQSLEMSQNAYEHETLDRDTLTKICLKLGFMKQKFTTQIEAT